MKFQSAFWMSICALSFFPSFKAVGLTCVMPKIKKADACGRVVAFDGQPIPEAVLSLTGPNGSLETRSDNDGNFSFRSASGSDFKIASKVEGFMPVNDWPVSELRSKETSASCRKPIFIVMALGGNSCSYATTSKKELPKANRK